MTAASAIAASSDSDRWRRIGRGVLPWLAIGIAFVHALGAGWRKWGSLLIDTGRELDVPRRLAEGQLLYRDAFFNYGPLAPYVNALLYRIFGVHLDVLVWAGVASAGLLCLALYRLARYFIPRWASAVIVVAFLYLCAFAHLTTLSIFSFVLPYSFSGTYGMVAAAWSLAFLIEHVESGRLAPFFASTACLMLAALSKLEPLVPAAAAHAVFLMARMTSRSGSRRVYFAGYGAALAVLLGVYGGFALAVGPGLWRENLAGVVNPGSRRFFLWVMGVGNLDFSLKALGISTLILAATLVLAGTTARWLSRRSPSPAVAWAVVGVLSAAAFFGYRYWQLHVHFRVLPLVMISTLAALAVLYLRQPNRRIEWLTHLLVWVFGFACLWRIPLNSKPQHYGFYLLPVGLVCLGVLFVDYGPRVVGAGAWAARAFGAAAIGLLAASSTVAFADSRQHDLRHTEELRTPRGRLLIANDAGLLAPAVRALSRLPPTTRLVTVPQGAGILYFSGLREGDSMDHYLPMDVYGPEADARLLSRWKGNPPDLVLWVGLPLAEFGSRGFGVDYARRSMAWVLENYEPLTNPDAFVVVMQHKRKHPPLLAASDLTPSPRPSGGLERVTGTVQESVDDSGTTLLCVQSGQSEVWVRVFPTKVAVGSPVTVVDLWPASVGESGFRRRTDHLFVGRLAPTGSAAQ